MADIKRKITFLGNEIELTGSDAKNPFLNMFLLTIEMMQIEFGKGVHYLDMAKKNYSLALAPELEKTIRDILKK